MANTGDPNPEKHRTATGNIEFSAVSARMPEGVSQGVFSTGVIILGATSETVLDFLQGVDQPTKVVARIVLPNRVLLQLVRAIEQTFPAPSTPETDKQPQAISGEIDTSNVSQHQHVATNPLPADAPPPPGTVGYQKVVKPESLVNTEDKVPSTEKKDPTSSAGECESPPAENRSMTQANIQDIYNDLKLPESLLAGSFANKVIVRSTQIECILDFVSQLFPTPCVSARVVMASLRVPSFLESLKQHIKTNNIS